MFTVIFMTSICVTEIGNNIHTLEIITRKTQKMLNVSDLFQTILFRLSSVNPWARMAYQLNLWERKDTRAYLLVLVSKPIAFRTEWTFFKLSILGHELPPDLCHKEVSIFACSGVKTCRETSVLCQDCPTSVVSLRELQKLLYICLLWDACSQLTGYLE